jgi:gamma-glutamylcyclotransferase (GGCT)/AIG2-like uncharacterized protein YtfP
MTYLFVYGTLLQHIDNEMSRFLAEHTEVIGQGSFQGKLFNVSAYPAAIRSHSAADQVVGAVVKVENAEQVFLVLDAYEGVDTAYYTRELVLVQLNTKQILNCWIYLYNRPTDKLEHIPSGDYANFICKIVH